MTIPGGEEIRTALWELFPKHHTFLEDHLFRPFLLPDDVLCRVRDLLDTHISLSLDRTTRHKTPLKLCPSYVTSTPDETENGTAISVDLGGTNLRAMAITLRGNVTKTEKSSCVIPSHILTGSGTKLFEFIVDHLQSFMKQQGMLDTPEPLPLGFTFSFPVNQTAINSAILKQWTKDFLCADVIGKDVGDMLNSTIKRRECINVRCRAVLNDTVATLIAGTLQDNSCAVGIICGTGTNGSYFEKVRNISDWPYLDHDVTRVAVDSMWNNIGDDGSTDFIRSEYDLTVAREATHSGTVLFEKLMCSQFLGDIVRQVLIKIHENNIAFQSDWPSKLEQSSSFPTDLMSTVLSDATTDDLSGARHALARLGVDQPSHTACHVTFRACQLVMMRAAHLTAVCTSCLVNRVDVPDVGIAVDGSLYNNSLVFRQLLHKKMEALVKPGIKIYGTDLQVEMPAERLTLIEPRAPEQTIQDGESDKTESTICAVSLPVGQPRL